MRAIVVVLLLSGCYDPHPPVGAYLCGASSTDMGTCPTNQLCECGQCVDELGQAACSFDITVLGSDGNATSSITLAEHQKFQVSISALDSSGRALPNFTGTVTLSSTWGDVCVGTSGCVTNPDTFLVTPTAHTATIQLNRETNFPQTAILRATYASAVGSSGSTQIAVDKPKAVIDANPITAPLTLVSNFGWAHFAVGAPFVIKNSAGWWLYFLGSQSDGTLATGVAMSADGISFEPLSAPLFTATSTTSFGVASAYPNLDASGNEQVSLFFGVGTAVADGIGFQSIVRSDDASTTGPFSLSGNTTLELPSGYAAIDTPMVIPDPAPQLSGGGSRSAVMYFSGASTDLTALTVLRAVATDGETFVTDPSPVLESMGDEKLIIGPRILVDGHTYKMWYSWVNANLANGFGCGLVEVWNIGYATSSDGYFWVRSVTNEMNPTVSGQGGSLLMGSVLPTDGVDPSNGVSIYYSPMKYVNSKCRPNGIQRAVLNGT